MRRFGVLILIALASSVGSIHGATSFSSQAFAYSNTWSLQGRRGNGLITAKAASTFHYSRRTLSTPFPPSSSADDIPPVVPPAPAAPSAASASLTQRSSDHHVNQDASGTTSSKGGSIERPPPLASTAGLPRHALIEVELEAIGARSRLWDARQCSLVLSR